MLRTSISRAAILLFLSPLVAAEDKVDFNRSVLPILSSHCYPCHGPDAKKRKARLRLDQRESATRKNRSGGQAIAPGDVKASELLKRIAATDDERMPPPDEGKALSGAQVQILKAWIDEGAEYQSHWAFKRPGRPKEPLLKNEAWPRNAIDRFVLSKLEGGGMKPALEARRETLIRAVSFDLTGLPPTLAEVDKFLADSKAGAYERMVDHYLVSPAYGEHMARH